MEKVYYPTVKNITDDSNYKKLSAEQQETVYNSLLDMLPEEKKDILKKTDKQSHAVFVCTNCGYTKKIDDKTKIFSRKSTDVSKNYSTNEFEEMVHSDILPRTRKYICSNKECISHKDPSKREAVFLRKNNSFKVVYVCTACKTVS